MRTVADRVVELQKMCNAGPIVGADMTARCKAIERTGAVVALQGRHVAGDVFDHARIVVCFEALPAWQATVPLPAGSLPPSPN